MENNFGRWEEVQKPFQIISSRTHQVGEASPLSLPLHLLPPPPRVFLVHFMGG